MNELPEGGLGGQDWGGGRGLPMSGLHFILSCSYLILRGIGRHFQAQSHGMTKYSKRQLERVSGNKQKTP